LKSEIGENTSIDGAIKYSFKELAVKGLITLSKAFLLGGVTGFMQVIKDLFV